MSFGSSSPNLEVDGLPRTVENPHTLLPSPSGRVYAAYGGVYVATALVWLKVVDGEKLSVFDWTGAGIALLGMGVIVLGWTAKE
ncbi:MAG: YnfA family protein [Nitrospira sp.]|nr:MAG: YnfA family protein [Nitrospira sp.]